ncbi:MAG: PIG-L family deacetylase [bacterium]|nr:PIG-L family deacetylase [bacterium]
MLTLSQPNADAFVPSGLPLQTALAHTTYLGVGAHQDDLEFMAYYPILKAFGNPSEWFTGVTVTNGSGSARSGPYENYSNLEMMAVRRREQNHAARIGKYSTMLQLDHPSAHVKDPNDTTVVDDLEKILRATRPMEVYTHNLADKHDTHVGVLIKLIAAIRRLPMDMRPRKLIGCEVWRDLDWLCDEDKVVMNVDGNDELADTLMAVFQSQIAGGKRYDVAEHGRRKAHTTMLESHAIDKMENAIFGMDMTSLIDAHDMEPEVLFNRYLTNFHDEVMGRHARLRST